ncbi:flavodoxin family protein [Flavobacterium urocaniciphilum]|uniref:Multimeric flavodoxin WrbA n=1 Tax=Flavobacterium urocaniciphilum TaxID=1299341 RepID=A0A1H9BVM7_9FLAO|nr:flavodoxin family protein [Flavobacterium urocaniciphilum]SEP92924.1 Multimeric flavodoxin WrbA [Flavobacterium urocaniciphilum]
MKNSKVIIVGSSRNNGNTTKIIETIANENEFDIVNLNDYQFSYYDYENKNREDDFLPLMKKIIENYETLIFATPIYWYNMSGIMKVFFDRISDLLTIEKELGRQLRGKNMAVIANTSDEELDYDFFLPFRKSAEYLGMNYLGDVYINANTTIENDKIKFLKDK